MTGHLGVAASRTQNEEKWLMLDSPASSSDARWLRAGLDIGTSSAWGSDRCLLGCFCGTRFLLVSDIDDEPTGGLIEVFRFDCGAGFDARIAFRSCVDRCNLRVEALCIGGCRVARLACRLAPCL